MRLLIAALLLTTGLSACGREPPPGPTLPTGAPWLRRTRGPVDSTVGRATLALASPARVRILYRRDGGEERKVFDDVLSGSQLVPISYSAVPRERVARTDPLPPVHEDPERKEVHAFALSVTIEGHLGILSVEPTVWTRPGLAETKTRMHAPSRLGEEIPFGSEVELLAVAVADTRTGSLRVHGMDGRTSARIDPPGEAEDRLHVLRLILRVEPAGDGRFETP